MRFIPIFGVLFALSASAQQQFNPRIGYVYPAGAQQGATSQITIGGQFLDGVSSVHISGAGATAKIVEFIKPLSNKDALLLRDKLKELQDKKWAATLKRGKDPATRPVWTDADEKMVAEIRKKLATFIRRPSSPAIAETVTIEVTVAADAPPGPRDLRLGVRSSLTNPMVFAVGQFTEYSEKPSRTTSDLDRKPQKYSDLAKSGKGEVDTTVSIPATINGQIMPGDVDRYRFKARKGDRLVVSVSARELIPYIPDAVPGWFQATLALYDAKGNELAFADDYRFNPDPVMYYQIPSDGNYVIEVRDSIYRGREDFIYRITIGELPFITGVYPLGGKAGEHADIELRGWNLPVNRLVQNKDTMPGTYPLTVRKGTQVSNRVAFAVDTLPECLEREPNDTPAAAHALALPVIVNGRIDKSGDRDVYRIDGQAGMKIVAEVNARRLNSPVDSVLRLTDSAGAQIAFNDDHEDRGSGLTTHHADSHLIATLPASGAYYLHVADTQNQGGPEYAYRLRVSPPRHDFELRVAPSSINVRGGATVPVTIFALRKDGFAGDITLSLKDALPGFSLGGARIPAGQDQVRFTLTAPITPTKEPVPIVIEGRASVDGREVVRAAVPAEDMMQAFAYRHLVMAQELTVAVSGRFAQKNQIRLLSNTPVRIPAGGSARVLVGMPSTTWLGKLQLVLSDPPEGITIGSTSPARGGGTEILLHCDASKVKPGLKGNLIVNAFANRGDSGKPEKAKNTSKKAPLGTLPAIPFEIVAK